MFNIYFPFIPQTQPCSVEDIYSGIVKSIEFMKSHGVSFRGVIVEGGETRGRDVSSLVSRLRTLFASKGRRLDYMAEPFNPSDPIHLMEYLVTHTAATTELAFFVYDPRRTLVRVLEDNSRGFHVLNL